MKASGGCLLIGTRETACVTDTSEYDLGEFCATGASTIGQLSIGLTGLLALAYMIWNLGYRQGTTGSSIGKSIMKFKVVSEKTGQPIGFGMSVVRELIYLVAAALCGIVWLIAVLFPLWDPKRQTLADKIITHDLRAAVDIHRRGRPVASPLRAGPIYHRPSKLLPVEA